MYKKVQNNAKEKKYFEIYSKHIILHNITHVMFNYCFSAKVQIHISFQAVDFYKTNFPHIKLRHQLKCTKQFRQLPNSDSVFIWRVSHEYSMEMNLTFYNELG